MHRSVNHTALLLLACLPAAASAQSWMRIDSVFAPTGVTVLNFSAPAFADLDADGDPDLLLGNGSSARVRFFRNLGAGRFMQDTSVLGPIYAGGSAGTNSDYPAAGDLDGDGDLDLVIGGFNGFLLYVNTGDSAAPAWLRVDTVFSTVNTQIGTDARPALGDLDADGDLDLLAGIGESLFGGPPAGITLGFRNTGTRTRPVFVPDNTLVAGIPDVGLNAYPVLRDLDADADQDLLMGRDLQTFIYYRNTGTPSAPVWTSDGTFAGIESSTYWKDPSFTDLDGDLDADLVYGTSDGTLFCWMNTGTPQTPQFSYAPQWFRVVRISGGASTAALADMDGDGDRDLVSGDWLGGIQYFRNDGNPTRPVFTRAGAAFTGIDVGSYSSPALVDVDGDNDADIVAGALDGRLFCYMNTGTAWTPNTALFASVDVGYRSLPAGVDIDGDGDQDVMVGAEEGALMIFLRNQGSGVFVSDPSLLAGITPVRNGHPAFADLDGDGDQDLLMGAGSGRLYGYRNSGSRANPAWTPDDGLAAGASARQDAAPGLADLDADGRADLVMGEYSGNFTYFRNGLPVSIAEEDPEVPQRALLVTCHPNPFNPKAMLRFLLEKEVPVEITMADLAGRVVHRRLESAPGAGEVNLPVDGSGLASGVYLVRVVAGQRTATVKVVLLR